MISCLHVLLSVSLLDILGLKKVKSVGIRYLVGTLYVLMLPSLRVHHFFLLRVSLWMWIL